MDKTCKSNADYEVAIFRGRSGARVLNTWAICRKVGDNHEKSWLIPNVTAGGHPLVFEVGDRKA